MSGNSSRISTVQPHKLLPNGVETHGWVVTTTKQPILNSAQLEELQKGVGLEKLPDMIFGRNYLRLHHPSTSFEILFTAVEGVRGIPHLPDPALKVSHSEKWAQGKKLGDYLEKSFNWTFSTNYTGTILVNGAPPQAGNVVGSSASTEEQININRLKAQDPILFYDEVLLYEDELGDCGSSVLNARVESSLPASGQVIFEGNRYRAYDTRYYHEFGQDYLLRETQYREGPYQPLKQKFEKEPSTLHDANILVPLLPIKETVLEKIYFKL